MSCVFPLPGLLSHGELESGRIWALPVIPKNKAEICPLSLFLTILPLHLQTLGVIHYQSNGGNKTSAELFLFQGVPLPFYEPTEEDGGKFWFNFFLANNGDDRQSPRQSCPGSRKQQKLCGRGMQNSKTTANQWTYRPFLQEPLGGPNLLSTDSGII